MLTLGIMKSAIKWLAVLALAAAAPVLAQESTKEKAKATVNDVKREGRKAGHRVDESLCTGTKLECEKRKLKHRGTEAKDKVKDEAQELKDKVDSDSQ